MLKQLINQRVLMREVYRSNNPVELSWISAALEEAGLEFLIADQFTSVMEGSIGAIQRRVLVVDDDAAEAEKLIRSLQADHD